VPATIGLQVWLGSQGMVYIYEEWEAFLERYEDWLALH